MPSFLSFVRDQYTPLALPQTPTDIADRTYIVTGANTGLGYECTKRLFLMGAGRVIIGVRSTEKGEAALTKIRNETGRQSVGEVWELDLTSLTSVETFSKRIDRLDRLDAVIENAGMVAGHFQLVDGIESSLLVNVVATMLLAFRALPKLQESARNFRIQPNLVIVSSNSAIDKAMNPSEEALRTDIFDALSTQKGFNVMTQYPKTKLLEIYAVRKLASLLSVSVSSVTINAVNPGLCYSELDRNGSFSVRLLLKIMRALLARSAEEGSRNLVQAAFASTEAHGTYFSECRIKEDDIPTWMTSKEGECTQNRVWEDLLKRLESSGHSVDIAALAVGK
ncbi:unnamed protein product [Periconia digitata]|uniref:Uncharacterized protein n=1 Tax=Periconia digitata TaxID=1303443 RepID=A0A9W4U327_9PLEO|nr:unnamed protein product [Periconia digitata]